jgi:hypothetical protein
MVFIYYYIYRYTPLHACCAALARKVYSMSSELLCKIDTPTTNTVLLYVLHHTHYYYTLCLLLLLI